MKELILIADDDATLLALLEKHLSTRGYHVVAVSDGVAATLKAQELKPNLVLMDVQMPGAYGFTVYNSLQQDPSTAGIPVVFMTGSLPEETFRKRIPESAKTCFLKKPFDLKTLDAVLAELLGPKSA